MMDNIPYYLNGPNNPFNPVDYLVHSDTENKKYLQKAAKTKRHEAKLRFETADRS